MANFTLDNLREAADRKYGNLVIETENGRELRLLNILRLGEAARARFDSIQEDARELSNSDEQNLDGSIRFARQVVETVVRPEDKDALFELIGDDNGLLFAIFEAWQEQTQAGEAEASQD